MKNKLNYYIVKLNRLSGWVLFIIIPLLLVTGFGITGKYKWMSVIATAEVHSKLHKFFVKPFVILFIIHSIINIYLSIKRIKNKWKKKKK